MGLNCLSSPCFLFHLFTFGFTRPCPSIFLVSIPLHPTMQPYYHSGSFPEFLLSLLSNWRPSAKKRPAVSYGCSELDRASSVCASSFCLSSSACRLRPVCHSLTPTPLCLISHWHVTRIRDNITVSLFAKFIFTHIYLDIFILLYK